MKFDIYLSPFSPSLYSSCAILLRSHNSNFCLLTMANADARLAASQMHESVTSLPPSTRYIISHNESGKSVVHSSPALQYYGLPGVGGACRSCKFFFLFLPFSFSLFQTYTNDPLPSLVPTIPVLFPFPSYPKKRTRKDVFSKLTIMKTYRRNKIRPSDNRGRTRHQCVCSQLGRREFYGTRHCSQGIRLALHCV